MHRVTNDRESLFADETKKKCVLTSVLGRRSVNILHIFKTEASL